MLHLVDDEFDKSPQEADHCFARRLYLAVESWRVQMLRGSSGWISLPFLASQYHNHQSQRHVAQRGQERHEATWIESTAQLASWTTSKSICWFGLYSKVADSWLLVVKTKESVHIVLYCFQLPKNQKPQRVTFVQSGDRMAPDYLHKPEGNSWNPRTSRVLGLRLALKDLSRQGQTLEIVGDQLWQKYPIPR